MSSEELQWASFFATALGSIFMGIQTLKVISAKLRLRGQEFIGLTEPVVCPNCGQRFDAWRFPVVDGIRTVTCPRCWYTFEA